MKYFLQLLYSLSLEFFICLKTNKCGHSQIVSHIWDVRENDKWKQTGKTQHRFYLLIWRLLSFTNFSHPLVLNLQHREGSLEVKGSDVLELCSSLCFTAVPVCFLHSKIYIFQQSFQWFTKFGFLYVLCFTQRLTDTNSVLKQLMTIKHSKACVKTELLHYTTLQLITEK